MVYPLHIAANVWYKCRSSFILWWLQNQLLPKIVLQHILRGITLTSLPSFYSGTPRWVSIWCPTLPPKMWCSAAPPRLGGPPGIYLLQATGGVWILFQKIPRRCLWKGKKKKDCSVFLQQHFRICCRINSCEFLN